MRATHIVRWAPVHASAMVFAVTTSKTGRPQSTEPGHKENKENKESLSAVS